MQLQFEYKTNHYSNWQLAMRRTRTEQVRLAMFTSALWMEYRGADDFDVFAMETQILATFGKIY